MDHLYPLLSRFGTGDAEPARILTRGILRWEIDQDSGALVAREHVEPAASPVRSAKKR